MPGILEKAFQLKNHQTNVRIELIAGFTTFLTMAYIIFVNSSILSLTGMDKGSVFVATIAAAAIGTLIMGLYANVPFAQAPGMGLNAFFTFTVVLGMGLSWQQALAIVFISGVLNMIITLTKLRKTLIMAIPESLQYAISGGIGLFIAYIGIKNSHFLNFITEGYNVIGSKVQNGNILEVVSKDALPTLVNFTDPVSIVALIGLVLIIVLMLFKVRGAILIGVIAATIVGLFLKEGTQAVTTIPQVSPKDFLPPSIAPTFFKLDLAGLFSNPARLFQIFAVILAFSLSDIFDCIGTLLGTGRKTGIFDKKDEESLEKSKGFSSKLDKALIADLSASTVGALLGTSSVTTYIESASGIAVGGRTGLTSVTTALLFIAALFIAPFALMVPGAATAPALIVVGILMMESFSKVKWDNFEEAVSAFFTAVIMPFTYSIANGVAVGFIFYVLIKLVKGKWKEVHPLMYIVALLFIFNFVISSLKK